MDTPHGAAVHRFCGQIPDAGVLPVTESTSLVSGRLTGLQAGGTLRQIKEQEWA
jgi:hypothetical protein